MRVSAVRIDAKTHMTEPTSTANNVDIAQRMRPDNLRHKILSKLQVCPQLPYKPQGHILLPNRRTLHVVVTKEPLTERTASGMLIIITLSTKSFSLYELPDLYFSPNHTKKMR
jgi:hypothetical protein